MRINFKNFFFLFIIPSLLGGSVAFLGFLLAIITTKPGCEAGEEAAPKLNCTFDESACEDFYDDYFYNCTTEENKQRLINIMGRADDKLILPYVMIGLAIGFFLGCLLQLCCCFNQLFQKEENLNESTYLLAHPANTNTFLSKIFHKIKFFCTYSNSNDIELKENQNQNVI